ncbi:MAG: hypothetical protein HOP30_20625 [Cyclobacteriaceae bacterium]|nr:hypothetical protein [Cyclobacteriaceae bacterium]
MKSVFLFLLTYLLAHVANAQYPFDQFESPPFKSYSNWKLFENKAENKIHQTITIPAFYADSSELTIQFTSDRSKKEAKNIIRNYKGKKTIQRFDSEEVDFLPFNTSRHPIKVADLNGDSLIDIKITYDYNTNGLSLSYRPIYLIQQENSTFIKYSFDNQYEDRIDFERDFDKDGTFEIQSVGMFGQNNHSYWIFQVYKITPSGLVEISERVSYPIFIQFLNKRNYKPADIKLTKFERDDIGNLKILTDKGTMLN